MLFWWLLKLSVPPPIKTAALSGHCSVGSYRELTGQRIFIHPKGSFTAVALNRTCQRHPPSMAFLWHSWHTHNAPVSCSVAQSGPLYPSTVCQPLFSHKVEGIFWRDAKQLRNRRFNVTNANKDKLEEGISLMRDTLTHTNQRKVFDYSAHGCTTGHWSQGSPASNCSIVWSQRGVEVLQRGPRRCSVGEPAEKCFHAALTNDRRAGQPLNGH